ncbi:hypothetical protein JTB14_016441 [Gonioctena quinquepunctata]|nr:hypothetical protein JTB14_016441 [Gonioctena quinquepunctata]
MRVLIFTYFLILIAQIRGFAEKKCCGIDEVLIEFRNSSYGCGEDPLKRLGVFSNSTNFLREKADGTCLDVLNAWYSSVTVKAGEVVALTPMHNGDFFRKCCPLGYVYNPKLHSCARKLESTPSFIDKNLIKVGLPKCKVIVDFAVEVIDPDFWLGGADFCLDEDLDGKIVRRECRDDLSICDDIRCIKKCCSDGLSFVGGSNCLETYNKHGVDLSFSRNIEDPTGSFALISNRACKRIYQMSEKRYIFTLKKNGSFVFYQNFTDSFESEGILTKNSYCIEHASKAKSEGFFFFKCFPDEKVADKIVYTLWAKILSCVFLGLTILIYIVLDETRNLFGKILINYCFGTLFLFSLLSYSHVNLKPSDKFCELTAYGLIFFSTVSLAWLNVMCWDIWLTFGSTKQSIGMYQRKKDLKRFFAYMIYGWGMPLLLTLIIFMFSSLDVLPYAIQPYVGGTFCFIEPRKNNFAALLFLRFPHLIIQIVNVILFIKTITYCLRIKNEINKINDTSRHEKKYKFKKDQERLFLILKLSVIMGVNYIFDTLTSFVNLNELGTVPKYIEIIWDIINCLQGVFIFIIFICKKKIYYEFLRKINIQKNDYTRNNTQTQSISSGTRISLKNGRDSIK